MWQKMWNFRVRKMERTMNKSMRQKTQGHRATTGHSLHLLFLAPPYLWSGSSSLIDRAKLGGVDVMMGGAEEGSEFGRGNEGFGEFEGFLEGELHYPAIRNREAPERQESGGGGRSGS